MDRTPPDDLIDDVAYLDSRLDGRAHRRPGLGAGEDRRRPGPRRRAAADRPRRRTAYHSGAAVPSATGRLVAWTELAGPDAHRRHAWQYITLVDPDHRGHRLGLLIKIDNLAYAREHRPELRAIDTFNAAANEHMLAINGRWASGRSRRGPTGSDRLTGGSRAAGRGLA